MESAGPSGHRLHMLDAQAQGYGASVSSSPGTNGGYFPALTAAEEEAMAFATADLPYEGKGKDVAYFPKQLNTAERITRIQVDPQHPFKPLEPAGGLPPFRPEAITRALKIEGSWLEVVGLLYPQATFCVTLWPPSENTTVRMSGLALAKTGVLLPPDARDDLYTVDLRVRDWPSGGVARIPDIPEARQLIKDLKGGFDILVDGEVWLFGAYNHFHDRDSEPDPVIKVMRGYEGVDGSQSDDVIKHWLDSHSGFLEDDEKGRHVAERMEYNHDLLSNPNATLKRKRREVVTSFPSSQLPNKDQDDEDRLADDDQDVDDGAMDVDLPPLPPLRTPQRRSAKKVRIKKVGKEVGDAPSSGRRRRGPKKKKNNDSDDDSDGDYKNYYALSRGESRSSAVGKSGGSTRTPRSARLKAQEALRVDARADVDMEEDDNEEDILKWEDVKAEPEGPGGF
ncbi:hypothetical protein B0T14DRAFT_554221 [Immersiella caudata]|uniref:Uncharacterized protein n=1 Tax=Immersiella caudata TaxID=314043 RepID=A0AA39WZ91_9PEZI|nr:hypothetical protein B0T14DRAFT_554221 [Immersiella caudata]